MIRSRARLAAAVLIVASGAAFAICISVERHADVAEHATQSPATSSPTAPAVTTAPGTSAPTSTATLGVAAGQGDADGGHDQVAVGGDGADSDGGSPAAGTVEPPALLFGVNLESTGLVAAAVVLEVLLAVAILTLGTAWLPAVIALVMLAFGTLGTWEILHQLEQFRFELAAVATAVALLHVLAAVAAYLARTGRIPKGAR